MREGKLCDCIRFQTGQSAFCVRIKRAGALLALARRRARKSVRAGTTPHDENPSPAPVACTRQIPADEQTAPPADVRAWAVSIVRVSKYRCLALRDRASLGALRRASRPVPASCLFLPAYPATVAWLDAAAPASAHKPRPAAPAGKGAAPSPGYG